MTLSDRSSAVHSVAQKLCHTEHGDWRYDPGDPDYDRFYTEAEELLEHVRQHLPSYLRAAPDVQGPT